MPAAIPLRQADQLRSAVVDFSNEVKFWNDYSEIEFSRLVAECKKLQHRESGRASLLLAIIYSSIGNFDQTEYYLRNAESNGFKDEALHERVMYLAACGFSSKALALFDALLLRPANRNIMDFAKIAVGAGAINKFKTFVEKSAASNMVLKMTHDYSEIQNASKAMNTLGVTDADLAAIFDIVGQLLRESSRGSFSNATVMHVLNFDNSNPILDFRFAVPWSPMKAAEVTWELTSRLIEADAAKLNVNVSIIGTSINEEIAA